MIAISAAPILVGVGAAPAATTDALLDDTTRPYFLWWTDTTVGQLKEHLASSDPEERAYWMGALLREANTRDVWLSGRCGPGCWSSPHPSGHRCARNAG